MEILIGPDMLVHFVVDIAMLVVVLKVQNCFLEFAFLEPIFCSEVFPDEFHVETRSVLVFSALIKCFLFSWSDTDAFVIKWCDRRRLAYGSLTDF